MDHSFTPEQEAYRQTIREFIKRNCSPELDRQLEREERYPHELLPKLAETGILGVYFPEEYGGIGGDACRCRSPTWPLPSPPVGK